jgi:hypothetical protein
MVEKLGSDQQQLADLGGGVISENGATLLSGESTGEASLLFGPAALREIQAGVANGDFAIPPADADATITTDNALPYWTFTDVSSAGAITAALVADAGAASGNVLRFTVASGTLTGKSATLTRFIPVASSASRSFSFYAEATFDGGTNSTQANAKLTCQFYKSDGVTTTGTAFESALYGFNSLIGATGITAPDLYAIAPDLTNTTAPADAAYLKLTITIATVATQSADRVVDLTEVRVAHGLPELILTDKGDPATYQPAYIFNESGDLSLVASTGENLVVGTDGYWLGSVSNTMESGGNLNLVATGDLIGSGENIDLTATTLMNLNADTISATATSLDVTGDLTATGNISANAIGVNFLYGEPSLTGPVFQLAGTNNRLWTGTSSAGAADLAASTSVSRAGILITKATQGQPTTNINGTGNTDAFSDALRNGGLAIDTTNNRGYWYSAGWKYTALTTPSDSRLKEEITDITGALDTLRQLVPVAFKWKRPEAHGRAECVSDDGTRMGFIADQVATTDLAHWVETLGVDEREADLVDTEDVLAVNIPQNEMEALVVQALLDIDARLKALESR